MLKTWQDDGKAEAGLLEKQIIMARHCHALASNKISKIPRPDLIKHLHALQTESVQLPWRLRLQVLPRRSNDLVLDLTSASKAEIDERAQLAASVVMIWQTHNTTCSDAKLQANDMWAAASATLKNKVAKGLGSPEDVNSEMKLMGEVGSESKIGAASYSS